MAIFRYIATVFVLFLLISCKNSYFTSAAAKKDIWLGEPNSGIRDLDLVQGNDYMIVTTNEEASKAGVEILRNGGNAIDAAIAAQMVLNVAEPHSSGIGGGGFLLYFDSKTKSAKFYNGRETAPQNVKEDMFLDKNGDKQTPKEFFDAVKGGMSVGTPGLLMMLKEAHDDHGKVEWKKLFDPAIKIANDGFPITRRMVILSTLPHLRDFDETSKIYLRGGKGINDIGDVIKNPQMAKTLKIIAQQGIEPFYRGEIARDMVEAVQKSKTNPGYLSLSDLKNYKIRRGDLFCGQYRKMKVCSMPQPSSSVTLLQILGMMENFDLSEMQPNSAEFMHLFAEVSKLAYADRNQYVADVKNVPLKEMLNENYLKKRANLVKMDSVLQNVEAGKFSENSTKNIVGNSYEPPSTTHLSIIDKAGNAVSLTSSIEYFFGSGISVDGFLLNNQLTDFSFAPYENGQRVVNAVTPGKQPRSSMSPTFIFDENDNLVMIIGTPGGPRIPQFVAKALIYHFDFGMDVQQAISAPNFVALNGVIELEQKRKLNKVAVQLEKIGHKTRQISLTSGLGIIEINRQPSNDNQKIYAGADPRREGVALGN